MNSYQTVNAAFAAAGLTKQAAVNYGRRFEAGLYDPFGRRSLFDVLVGLQARVHDSVYAPPEDHPAIRACAAGGVAAASAGGTSAPKFYVQWSERHDGLDAGWFVYRTAGHTVWDGPYTRVSDADAKRREREAEAA